MGVGHLKGRGCVRSGRDWWLARQRLKVISRISEWLQKEIFRGLRAAAHASLVKQGVQISAGFTAYSTRL